MTVENKQLDMKDILTVLNKASESFTYEVWIPSLKRNVMFKEINTAQQKKLVKSIIDSPIYNTQFILALYDIIKENCADNTVDINSLTIIDKLFIAATMRSYSIDDMLEMSITLSDGSSVKRGVSLKSTIDKIKDQVTIPHKQVFKDEKEVFTLECSVPTIETEYKLDYELRSKLNAADNRSIESMREMIGEAFVGEIIKYINSISIKNGAEEILINLNDLTFANRITLLESLPIKLVERVIDYIKQIKTELEKVTLIKFVINDEKTGKEKETIERGIAIDGSFFTRS